MLNKMACAVSKKLQNFRRVQCKFLLFKGVWYPKYGDVHEKFIFLENQDLKPLRTGQKHFETILPNFPPDEL